MRQHAGALNRTWLVILGILALAGGVLILLAASGTLHAMSPATVAAENPVVTGDLHTVFEPASVTAIVLVAGILLGALGLLWILAQIPRRNPADRYRLHQDPASGTTLCEASVLGSAVENQINTLPGVVGSSALLRGSAREPDLTMKVTVNNRADIQDILHSINARVIPDLSTALETPLRRTGIQLEVSGRNPVSGSTVATTGTVIY
ncbi:hypothetical protein QFZ23_002077 [Arthrobacter globiformis]|uniref:hypothetical protein n=1 Tax=Arthrobacter globiformis TaxID=1665 RepID=UPI00277F5469|nr:hypothetical protein [Arthrobacter globiformis]MDQ1058176.1 hypothetical protein [Arthrobacter globiformis]